MARHVVHASVALLGEPALEVRFVRGEVVAYDDFKKYGSMKEAKHHGVYRLEGKTYVLKDGDIMHVLAST